MEIYHNPRCAKSRDTLKILMDKNVDVKIKEYLKDGPTKAELSSVIEKLGIKPVELVRKGEAIYKEQYKGKELSDNEWIDAMVANPTLIERPIVIKDEKAVIGRPPENVLGLL
jgi:arsenate reductase